MLGKEADADQPGGDAPQHREPSQQPRRPRQRQPSAALLGLASSIVGLVVPRPSKVYAVIGVILGGILLLLIPAAFLLLSAIVQ